MGGQRSGDHKSGFLAFFPICYILEPIEVVLSSMTTHD
jgi:hypothetical protein